MEPQKIGIIDMGSNSVRFVIYEVDRHACYKEVQNLKVIARLSTYINTEGYMTSEGIEVILNTLTKFKKVADKFGIDDVRGVATAAVRNAGNRKEILEAINTHGVFKIQILSEQEEAYYGYLAITNSTNYKEGVTIDIGGGSTEVTYFKDRRLIHSFSFPFGALTLKKQFVKDDTPTEAEWKKLRAFLRESYASLPWLKEKNAPVIGIGGSARNLALVHQNQINYPLSGLHQYEMTNKDVWAIQNKLASLPIKKREKVDGLSKDRADIILPAAAAIEELIAYVNTSSFIVSNKGLRDGLFYEKFLNNIEITHFPDVTQESIYQLVKTYQDDEEHQRRIAILSSYFVNELNKLGETHITSKELKLLQWSSQLFYLGSAIHPESQSQHTFYLLTNQSIDGLGHLDRLSIAFISSFKSKSQLKQYIKPFRHWVTANDINNFELMGSILKLCYGLDISQRNVVKKVELDTSGSKSLVVNISYEGDPYFESFHANKYKKHLERSLNKTITLNFTDDH
ncbi:exopolyphosphatase [Salipaludibacillus aurantiacus]|uniref:exopolyphosphatase n=1 Tax=Salipaludibacillus aurantiacus TaxID=1601833 RepID=A0A1H9R9Y1_9BACI|nr:exopolyphosphatase [Salipaludibacillus aurantiacus]SER69478.1 exopolyphosphatase / guanosine-5'-triphosphate,3'-diphosphate pyrophosphatase [Salipaludibacillus aurantiacus]